MRILPDEESVTEAAARLLAVCRAARLTIATAESCTGGLIAAVLTAIPGSSDVVQGGFVTYSNTMKCAVLGVAAGLIARDGAVSDTVAGAMAHGALARSEADLAIAVTGVAGPGGGSPSKPVGLVYLAAVRHGGASLTRREIFGGDRQQIRASTVQAAIGMLAALAAPQGGGSPASPASPGPPTDGP